jgi:hypothetical protein
MERIHCPKSTSSSFTVDLPSLQDYQQHSTEIKADQLNPGIYIILTSTNPSFSFDNNLLVKQVTRVSNISFINNDKDYYVLHRDNGKPLANTNVQVWRKEYNYKTSKYQTYKAEQYQTDKNGLF